MKISKIALLLCLFASTSITSMAYRGSPPKTKMKEVEVASTNKTMTSLLVIDNAAFLTSTSVEVCNVNAIENLPTTSNVAIGTLPLQASDESKKTSKAVGFAIRLCTNGDSVNICKMNSIFLSKYLHEDPGLKSIARIV